MESKNNSTFKLSIGLSNHWSFYFYSALCVLEAADFIANDTVNSRARRIASASSFFQTSATLLSNGSSGLGADKSAWMLNNTVRICKAGLHLSLRISRQILPNLSTLGWYILVKNRTLGGAMG